MANKKATSSNIINLAKQEFASKKVRIVAIGGQEFDILVQEKINDTKVMNLVADLVDRSKLCDKNKIEFNIMENIYFLLIKYFTDIKINKYDDLEKQYLHELEMMDGLLDLNLFKQIVVHFNEESIKKISEMFDTYAQQMKVIMNNEVKNNIINGEKDGDNQEQ